MASSMFLYWGSGSIPCMKAMIVLEEKGLSGYPNKKISFSDKEHKSEEVMKLNPRGQMPTFKDGDVVVNESNAICFYLENKFPDKGTKLLSGDKAEFGRIVQRCAETTNIQTIFLVNLAQYIFRTAKDQLDKELLKTKKEAVHAEFKVWEDYLAAGGGYVVGSDFTMADVFFFPYVVFAVRVGLDRSKYPSISAYYDKVKDRPSMKASWPPHWLEGPGDTSILGPV